MKTPSTEALEALDVLLNITNNDRLNNSLRRMLVEFLLYNKNGLPTDFEQIIEDFDVLSEFLHKIGNG